MRPRRAVGPNAAGISNATSDMTFGPTPGPISIDNAAQPDFRTASSFLRSVFIGQERGVLAIFCKPSNVSHFAHLDRPGWHSDAAFRAIQLRDHFNVYFAVGLRGGAPGRKRPRQRGGRDLAARALGGYRCGRP